MNASRSVPAGANVDGRGFIGPPTERAFEEVRAAIGAIRFGEVRVIIQDGVIVQIDRIEKQRLR